MQLHPEQLDEAELPRDENTSFLVIGFWEFHEKNQEGAHATVFFGRELCFYETSSFYLHIYTGLGITTNIQRRKYLVIDATLCPFPLAFIRVVIFFSLGERLFKSDYVLSKFKAVVGNVLMY